MIVHPVAGLSNYDRIDLIQDIVVSDAILYAAVLADRTGYYCGHSTLTLALYAQSGGLTLMGRKHR